MSVYLSKDEEVFLKTRKASKFDHRCLEKYYLVMKIVGQFSVNLIAD